MQYVFLIVLGSVGIVLLYVGLTQCFRQWALLPAPRRVSAKITRSFVSSRDFKNEDDSKAAMYRLNVEFVYTIDGRTFKSDLLKPTTIEQTYGSRDLAERQLEPFPPGATVDAYYVPDHPGSAYLVPEPPAVSKAFLIAGALLPVVTFVICRYLV